MNLARVLFALTVLVCVNAIAAEPSVAPSSSASPAASELPATTFAQSFSQLSAQSAAAERSKIYRAGAASSRWLDQIANDSGNAFLQRPVFDRVTWMRLLASAGTLALLSIFAGSFVW